MEVKKVEEILKGEPTYRLKQVKQVLFQDLLENWEEARVLPKNLRQKLSVASPIQELKAEKILISKGEQTIKALLKLKDGLKIESVLMKHGGGRRTVCVSSQVGCVIGCKFCATGQPGFTRSLSADEIVEQVLFFAQLLKRTQERVSNVVFMGMGEPFLNYDNVWEAVKILNDKDGFNLGARHISISTVGIVGGIKRLTQERLQVNLAISLHAPNNKLRSQLIPINDKYPIEEILAAVDVYIKKTKRRVMFEYLMLNEVNDYPAQAEELISLFEKKPLYFVNLISFNPITGSEFTPSSTGRIMKFKEALERGGIPVTQRYRFGREIQAGCGQLAGEK